MLPVSLFGMSVSAAELPAMSSALGGEAEVAAYLRQRLDSGLRQIAFFIVPSAMAFLALGDVVAAALFQTGRFTASDSLYVWGILAGSAVGLLASTLGRLYSSTYYALRDTRTPLRYAVIRVALTTALGYLCAIPLPPWLGIEPRWGVAGLTASAGVAGWVEFALLRRTLNRAHRPHRPAREPGGEALGFGRPGGIGGLGGEAGDGPACPRPGCERRGRSGNLWGNVLRDDLSAGGEGIGRRAAQAGAASLGPAPFYRPFQFDADEAAPCLKSDKAGGAGAGEGDQNRVARVRPQAQAGLNKRRPKRRKTRARASLRPDVPSGAEIAAIRPALRLRVV